jgi:hypothetical protein
MRVGSGGKPMKIRVAMLAMGIVLSGCASQQSTSDTLSEMGGILNPDVAARNNERTARQHYDQSVANYRNCAQLIPQTQPRVMGTAALWRQTNISCLPPSDVRANDDQHQQCLHGPQRLSGAVDGI